MPSTKMLFNFRDPHFLAFMAFIARLRFIAGASSSSSAAAFFMDRFIERFMAFAFMAFMAFIVRMAFIARFIGAIAADISLEGSALTPAGLRANSQAESL